MNELGNISDDVLNQLSTNDLRFLSQNKLEQISTQGLRLLQQASQPIPEDVPTPQNLAIQPPGFVAQQPERNMGDIATGVGEAALSTITGIPAAIAGQFGALPTALSPENYGTQQGAQKAMQRAGEIAGGMTYQPRTAAGQEYVGNIADIAQQSGVAGLAGMGNIGRTMPSVKKPTSTPAQNAPRDTILKAAQQEGYSALPSQVGAGFGSRTLETMSGKYKAEELASSRNQLVTNNLARKYLNLPEDSPLSELTFEQLKKDYGKPYEEVRQLPKTQIGVSTTKSPKTGQPVETKIFKSGNEIIDELQIAREDASILQRRLDDEINPPENPAEIRQRLQSTKNTVRTLENQLEKIAIKNKRQDLLPELQRARVNIAKVYSVQNATNTDLGMVDARKIGKQINRGKRLTDELRLVGSFANAFPKVNKFVPESPNMATIYDVAFATGLGAFEPTQMAAALPLGRIASRYTMLNPTYQRMFVNPQYSQTPNVRIPYNQASTVGLIGSMLADEQEQ